MVDASIRRDGFLRSPNRAPEAPLAQAITKAMREATNALKLALRDDVLSAGLGQRVANTWRDNTYPKSGGSLQPTGFIWSKAPRIAQFFDSGNPVVPLGGRRYLAIPTAEGRALTGKRRRRLTVPEIEARLGRPLIVIPGKSGHLLVLYDQSLNKAGRRKRGAARRDLVLLFTFVPTVAGQKRIDVQSVVDQIGATVPAAIDRAIRQ